MLRFLQESKLGENELIARPQMENIVILSPV